MSTAQQGQPVGVAVVVIDADQQTRSRLAMQLGQGATPFASIDELAPRLGGSPVVIVLGPSVGTGDELAKVSALVLVRPELGAIMVTDELNTQVLQQAMKAGIKDVLAAPVDTEQLTRAVTEVASGLTVKVVAAVAPPPVIIDDEPGEAGRVITVFSTKGGAGKSVIASSLAVLLAQRSDRPVCLVDADLQFGDIAVMLKLVPQHTIVDAVSVLDKLDPSLLQSLLVQHEPSKLLVLPAPLEPAFADQIGAAEVIQILDVLRSFCSHIVVDTPAYFNDVVLGLIEVSDDVLLVAGLDIPNIKNVKIGLQTLRLLNTPMDKIRLVLNRADSKVGFSLGDVEKTLQMQAQAKIPSDVAVVQAVNAAKPVVLSAPKSPVSRALEELADMFIPSAQTKKKK